MLSAYHTNTTLQNCALCYILLACIVSQRQPHQSRSTGHGNAWTRPDSTRADEAPAAEVETDGERDTETAPTAEPPRDQTQKRNARRARASTTAAAETRPPADNQPHQSRRDRARAREPEARHCRPLTETDRDREKKSGKREGTKRKRQ